MSISSIYKEHEGKLFHKSLENESYLSLLDLTRTLLLLILLFIEIKKN